MPTTRSGRCGIAVWRTALVMLFPLAAFTWLLLWLIDVAVTCYALAATVIYLTAERLFPRPERLSRLLFGCSVKELAAETPTGPAWLESILSVVARVLTAPLAVALFAVLWFTAFIRMGAIPSHDSLGDVAERRGGLRRRLRPIQQRRR